MDDQVCVAVEQRLGEWYAHDAGLEAAVAEAKASGLPEIHVNASVGKLLYLLTRLVNARRVVEIGTLGGFSGTWIARGLTPSGFLITLEKQEKHAAVARKTFERAGVAAKVDLRVGDATALTAAGAPLRGEGPFDLVFIDADKASYPAYLDFALATVRSGGLIVADNLIRNGRAVGLAPAEGDDAGLLAYNQRVAREPRLEAVILPTLRHGLDGIGIARVK